MLSYFLSAQSLLSTFETISDFHLSVPLLCDLLPILEPFIRGVLCTYSMIIVTKMTLSTLACATVMTHGLMSSWMSPRQEYWLGSFGLITEEQQKLLIANILCGNSNPSYHTANHYVKKQSPLSDLPLPQVHENHRSLQCCRGVPLGMGEVRLRKGSCRIGVPLFTGQHHAFTHYFLWNNTKLSYTIGGQILSFQDAAYWVAWTPRRTL